MKLIEILKNGGWGRGGGVRYMPNETKRVYRIKMLDQLDQSISNRDDTQNVISLQVKMEGEYHYDNVLLFCFRAIVYRLKQRGFKKSFKLFNRYEKKTCFIRISMTE